MANGLSVMPLAGSVDVQQDRLSRDDMPWWKYDVFPIAASAGARG